MEELDAKRRFIQAILDERLILQKRTDEEIVAQLKVCDIPALTCMEKPDEYDSYEYVLKMRIDRVKHAAVIELDKQIGEKQEEIERLEAETATSLWLTDLDEFEEAWTLFSKERISESMSVAKSDSQKPKVARKRPGVVKK
jgi:hypothetical protein